MEKKRQKAILYSRVSTAHDEQAESIENQILLAKNYLDKHPEIELAEPLDKYSEKISGKTDIRPRFQELCERLSRGDVHFLMIKDLKRLSRSVETTYAFFNMMKQYDFEIIQLSSGNIIDSRAFEEVESNLLLGIEALFAQNTVLTQSRYGRTVHKVRCENKKLSYKDSTLFGYEWNEDLNDIVVVEEEAEVIRQLFYRYVFRNEGTRELRTFLTSLGYHYSDVTVGKWLQEGKYIGDWTINRKGSTLGIGQGAKSHRFQRDKSEWVHVERPDLAIVDKELFDLAQDIRLNRIHRYYIEGTGNKSIGRFTGKHLFAGKIICAECGCSYQFYWSDRHRTVPAYRDSFRIKIRDHEKKCPNNLYRKVLESEVTELVVRSIEALNLKGSVSISRMIEAISFAVTNSDKHDKRIESEKTKLKKLEKEAAKISNAFIDASPAMRGRLNDQLDEIEKRISDCKQIILKSENRSADREALKERLRSVEEQLKGWIDITEESLDRIKVEKLISKILIHMDGKVDIHVKIGGIYSFHIDEPRRRKDISRKTDVPNLSSVRFLNDNVQQFFSKMENKENRSLSVLSFQTKTSRDLDKTVTVSIETQ